MVKDRIEQTGNALDRRGSPALLQLRAIYLNGDWPNFVAHRIESELSALFPYKYSLAT